MRVRLKAGFVLAFAALLATASAACGDQNAFQPITYGAKPWTPPVGWAPTMQCAVGYFVTIDSCPGCPCLSYALCTGVDFNQCVCGSSYTPGAMCPNQFHCAADDFPPQGWQEFADYIGPGWAGHDNLACVQIAGSGMGGPDSGAGVDGGGD